MSERAGHTAPPQPASDDVIVRAKQTQCCDPIIDGVLGSLIEECENLRSRIEALTAERDVARAEVASKSDQIGKLYTVCNERDVLKNSLTRAEAQLATIKAELGALRDEILTAICCPRGCQFPGLSRTTACQIARDNHVTQARSVLALIRTKCGDDGNLPLCE